MVNTGAIAAGVTFGGIGVIINSGLVTGGVRVGDGGAQLTNSGQIDGGVIGGLAATITNTGMLTGNLVLSGGSVMNSGSLANDVILSGGGIVTNSGMIGGSLRVAIGDASVINAGTVAGPVAFGSGNDTLTLQHGSRISRADGGTGENALVLALGGSDATLDEITLGVVTNFQTTRVTSGVVAALGSYTTSTLIVATGRFIGRAGSTIVAPAITVAPGATSGSAGTVVGNIAVAGVLSPGASPGTMTVTGNVALASGSTSLFELTPAVSDQLLVSGMVTIAGVAKLALSGARPLTPGAPLNLIVAGGGIIGDFTTITQPTTILGFIRQSTNRLQLFGQFAIDPAFSSQTALTVAYFNRVLVGGSTPAVTAAIPVLLTTGGVTNGAAFAQLNAEAYASASRIGTENGLTLVIGLRGAGASATYARSGLFTFVEGLGAWRRLDGDVSGVSRADVSSGGVAGGIGVAIGPANLTGFGGHLDSR